MLIFKFKSITKKSKCRMIEDNLLKFKQKIKESCTNPLNLRDSDGPYIDNMSGSRTNLEKDMHKWTPK